MHVGDRLRKSGADLRSLIAGRKGTSSVFCFWDNRLYCPKKVYMFIFNPAIGLQVVHCPELGLHTVPMRPVSPSGGRIKEGGACLTLNS